MLLKLILPLCFIASLNFGQLAGQRHPNKVRPPHPPSSSRTKSSFELVRLIEKFRAHGVTVVLTKEKVSQPFFATGGRVININGEALQVFEYATPARANTDAKQVSADGTTIGTSKPTWIASPHFFKSGKLIVLYIGENQTVLDVLRTTLGNQFAGM